MKKTLKKTVKKTEVLAPLDERALAEVAGGYYGAISSAPLWLSWAVICGGFGPGCVPR